MESIWLVAYDFSRLAHAALATAADMLAKQGGGQLIVVHVHQLGTGVDGNSIDLALVASSELEHAYINDAERQLAEDVAAIRNANVTVSCEVIHGRAATVLCNRASETKAQLLVVGSHGRRGLERLVLGSVAESILRHAPCSVLVVKAPFTAAQSSTSDVAVS